MPLISISYFAFIYFFFCRFNSSRLVADAARHWSVPRLLIEVSPSSCSEPALFHKNGTATVHELLMKEPIRRVPLTHQLHNYQLKAARLAAALQRRANQSITSQRVIHIHGHIPLPLLAKTLTTNAL